MIRIMCKKIKLCLEILTAPGGRRYLLIDEMSALEATVRAAILDQIVPHNYATEQKIGYAAGAIANAFSSFFPRKSDVKGRLFDAASVGLTPLIDNRLFHFSQLCGLMGAWELRVQLFADLIGIRTLINPEERTKKAKADGLIRLRSLKVVIPEIENRCPGKPAI